MAGLSGTFPVYAPAADLNVYVGGEDTPADIANAADLLARASADVRRATRAAVYRVDGDQFATHAPTRDALHDATIIQAAALYSIGWTKTTAPTPAKARVVSKSLGGASVTYDKSDEQRRAEALADGDLDGYAVQVLEDAGLLSTGVQSARAGTTRPLYRVRGLS